MNYILPIPHYVGIGTTFNTPILTLSAYNKIFLKALYIDYGCDFGFVHGLATELKGVGYYSFYPNAHIGLAGGSDVENGGGVFLGLGGGAMLSTYTFPRDTVNTVTPAFDISMGFRVRFFELTYSMRFANSLVNHKLQAGFRVIPKL